METTFAHAPTHNEKRAALRFAPPERRRCLKFRTLKRRAFNERRQTLERRRAPTDSQRSRSERLLSGRRDRNAHAQQGCADRGAQRFRLDRLAQEGACKTRIEL